MVDPVALIFAGGVCFVFVIILLAHHIYEHGPYGHGQTLSFPDRMFQMSDVCNFRTWNHEMWILFLLFVGTCFFGYWVYNDSSIKRPNDETTIVMAD